MERVLDLQEVSKCCLVGEQLTDEMGRARIQENRCPGSLMSVTSQLGTPTPGSLALLQKTVKYFCFDSPYTFFTYLACTYVRILYLQ
jgi:hypothetical protein